MDVDTKAVEKVTSLWRKTNANNNSKNRREPKLTKKQKEDHALLEEGKEKACGRGYKPYTEVWEER